MICFACEKEVKQQEVLKCIGCKTNFHYVCLNVTSAAFREKKEHLSQTIKCDSCCNITCRVKVTEESPNSKSDSTAVTAVDVSPNETVTVNTATAPITMSNVLEMIDATLKARLKALEVTIIQEMRGTMLSLTVENGKQRKELQELQKKCDGYEEEIKVLKRSIQNKEEENGATLPTTQPKVALPAPATASSRSRKGKAAKSASPTAGAEAAAVAASADGAPVVRTPPATATTPAPAALPTPPPPRQPYPPPAALSAPQPVLSYAAAAATARNNTLNEQSEEQEDGAAWTEVKKRPRLNPVNKGENISSVLKAVERFKYMHIWRLDQNITEETLKEFIKNVIGADSELSVLKLKPKIARRYASFKVGVPETKFNQLCDTKVWPINVEFSEWTWFRS